MKLLPDELARVTMTTKFQHYGVCPKCQVPGKLLKHLFTVSSDGELRSSREIILCKSCDENWRIKDKIEIPISVKSSDVKDPLGLEKRQAKERIKHSQKREKQTAEELGGRTTRRSGAGLVKGDVIAGFRMIEDKFTRSGSYRLTPEVLDKARYQAKLQGLTPIIKVGLEAGPKQSLELAIMDWSTFLELVQRSEDGSPEPNVDQ